MARAKTAVKLDAETEVAEAPKAEGNVYAATNVGTKNVILEQPEGVVAYITRREYEDARAAGKVVTYKNEQYVDVDPAILKFPERFAAKITGISDETLEKLLHRSGIFSLNDLNNKTNMSVFYQNVMAAVATRLKALK